MYNHSGIYEIARNAGLDINTLIPPEPEKKRSISKYERKNHSKRKKSRKETNNSRKKNR